MTFSNRFSTRLNNFLEVPSIDPDDARRRKLLNIILAFVGGLTLLVVVVSPILTIVHGTTFAEDADIYLIAVALFIGTAFLVFLNRTLPGWVASWLFLLFLLVTFIFSDSPKELVDGRSLVHIYHPDHYGKHTYCGPLSVLSWLGSLP